MKPATKAEGVRADLVRELGCVACMLQSRRLFTEADLYFLQGPDGATLGWAFSVALCRWHLSAEVPAGCDVEVVRARRGPSLLESPAGFRRAYGSDEDLLLFQDAALRKYVRHLGCRGHLLMLEELENGKAGTSEKAPPGASAAD